MAVTFAAGLATQSAPPMERLLQQAGMRVAVAHERARASRELRVRWLSEKGADGKPTGGRLQFIERIERNDPPPRQRSPEMSSDQLVVTVLDAQDNVRCWQIVTDPRLVRGEFPDASGNLHKTVFYRTDVELNVSVPGGIDAAEVRILGPGWDNQGELKLSTLTALKLAGTARQ